MANMTTNWVSTERFEYADAARKIADRHNNEENNAVFIKTVDKENRCVKYHRVKPNYKPKDGEILHHGKI